MAKTTKKSNSASLVKRGNAKTMSDAPIDVDIPPQESQRHRQPGVKVLLHNQQEGVHHNPWLRGSKNYIDVVFHNGGVPAKIEEPNITLDKGGKALHIEWKLPEKLFTAMQAIAQSIPMDSAWYDGYCNIQTK
jgi:hypothetical protein